MEPMSTEYCLLVLDAVFGLQFMAGCRLTVLDVGFDVRT